MKKVIASTQRKEWLDILPATFKRLVSSFASTNLRFPAPVLRSIPSFIHAHEDASYHGSLHGVGNTHLDVLSLSAFVPTTMFDKQVGLGAAEAVPLPAFAGKNQVLPALNIVGRGFSSTKHADSVPFSIHRSSLTRAVKAARNDVKFSKSLREVGCHRRKSRVVAPLSRSLTDKGLVDTETRPSFGSEVILLTQARRISKRHIEPLQLGDHRNLKIKMNSIEEGLHVEISVNFDSTLGLQDGVAAGKKVQTELFKMAQRDIYKMTLNFKGDTSMDFISFYSKFGPWKVKHKEFVITDFAAARSLFDTLGSTGFQGIMLVDEKMGDDVVVHFPSNFKSHLLQHIENTKREFSPLGLGETFDMYSDFVKERSFTQEKWDHHILKRSLSHYERPLTGFIFDLDPVEPYKASTLTRKEYYPYDSSLRVAIEQGKVVANSSDQNTAIGDGWSIDPGNAPLTQLLHDIVLEGKPHVHVLTHHHHDHNAHLWLLLKAVKTRPELRNTLRILHFNSYSSRLQLAGLLLSDPKRYLALNSILHWVEDHDVVPMSRGCVTICEPPPSLRHFIDSIGAVFFNVSKVVPGQISFDVTHVMGDVNAQFFPIDWKKDAERVKGLFDELYDKVFAQIRERVIEAKTRLMRECPSEFGNNDIVLNLLALFEIGHFVGMPEATQADIFESIRYRVYLLKSDGVVDDVDSTVAPYHMKCDMGFSSGKVVDSTDAKDA